MRVRSLAAVLSALLAVAMAAGGCSSDTSDDAAAEPDTTSGVESTESPEPADQQSVALSCDLAPADMVRSSLGADVSPPAEISNASGVECTYLTGIGGRTVVVRLANGDGPEAFAIGRQGYDASGQPTTDVTGLGDEAYRSSTEFGDVVTTTLVARKGTIEVLVISVATAEQEVALVQKIFAAIP